MQIAAELARRHESNSRLRFWRRTLESDDDLADVARAVPDRQFRGSAAPSQLPPRPRGEPSGHTKPPGLRDRAKEPLVCLQRSL